MADETTKNEKTPETPDEDTVDEISSDDVTGESDTEELEVPENTVKAEKKEEEEEKELSGWDKVALLNKAFFKDNIPEFRPGDTLKVHVKIIEGNKERIQAFEGVCIAIRNGGLDRTFTVRKNSWGVGVERTFFIHSKKIDRIEVVRHGKVRRAKLYYLRERAGKSARIKEKRFTKK